MGGMVQFSAVDIDDLDEYPLTADDRLDSHFFYPWERRRWLHSDMRLKGSPECRGLYMDLIFISCDHTPVGTLPDDMEILANEVNVDARRFSDLCALPFGPLHRWEKCLCDGEVRLMHPYVLKTLLKALAGKHDNQARNEAGRRAKRLQRVREHMMGYAPDLGKNDAAVIFIDDWLEKQGVRYRTSEWVERGIGEWSNHMMDLGGGRGPRR
jgi:hypothetical protein